MKFRHHKTAANAATARLLLVFAGLVLALIVVVNAALAALYLGVHAVLFSGSAVSFPAYFFATNTGLVLLFVLGGAGVESLRMVDGGAHVARMIGAREAQPTGGGDLGRLERRFINIVHEMAIANRMRATPSAYVLDRDDAINAFAAGWSEGDHVVGVTRGALERLTREELQGVVAHEFSHITSGDTRRNMRLVGLVWGLQMVHGFGESLAARDDLDRLPMTAPVGFVLQALGWVGFASGRMLQAAVSRQREFHADAAAVEATRLVAGLGGALRKIAAQVHRSQSVHATRPVQADALRATGAGHLAHMLLHHRGRQMAQLLATHPPISARLRRLYGRTVEAVQDVVQPTPADEALVAFVSSADALTGGAAKPSASVRAVAVAPLGHSDQAGVDASLHDPTQPHRDKAREFALKEALARIARWTGPMERRAGTLALLFAPHDQDAWSHWAELINHTGTTDRVRSEIQTLGVEGRMEVFKSLMQGWHQMRAEERALLRQQAKSLTQRMAASSPTRGAMGRLRRLAMLRLLRHAVSLSPSDRLLGGGAVRVQHPLAAQLPGTIMTTAALAVAVAGHDASDWLGHVRDQLGAQDVQAPQRVRWAMRSLAHVRPTDQAKVVQAWIKATRKMGMVGDDSSRESLHLAALALGVSTPSLR
jgi:Zn-dependent protease with chaperone function